MSRHALAAATASLAALLSVSATAIAQGARARDSASVTIVETAALKDAPVRFRLGDIPLLQVGGIESNPDEEFDHKQGYLHAARLSNGGLAVIDVSRVHYFDAQGKRIRIVGRKGQGPEEFQYLTAICRTRGDTLFLNDMHNRRMSVLDGNGRILRTIVQGDNGSASPGACLDDGTFFLLRRTGDMTAGQNRLTRLRSDGSVVNVIGTFPAAPFDMVTQVASSFTASGNMLWEIDPFGGDLRAYDVSGRLRRVIRTADRGDRISDAEVEERLSMTIPRNVSAEERKTRMEMMRSRPHATTWPVFLNFELGEDGTIWVQDYKRKFPSPDAWTAIDSTGRIVGRLQFPDVPPRTIRPQVLGFGRDYVMVRRFDADGATSIALLPLIKVDGRNR